MRQSRDVWKQFGLFMPGAQRDFMRKAPCKKLAVGVRTKAVYHQPMCIRCSILETIRHVFSRCKFMPLAADVVAKFGMVC